MAGYPPPYPPPPPPGSPYGGPQGQNPQYQNTDWRYQRRYLKDQARAQREAFRAQRDAYRAQSRNLRRGSVVGPVLVIAIGIVFLMVQTGHIASEHLWDWYGRWWPVLLIGVGGVVLVEWIIDQAFHRDAPYGRRSIGGGIIFLLIILALTGLSYEGFRDGGRHFLVNNFNLNQDDIDQFIGDKHESDQNVQQVLPVGGTVEVDNPRGDVTLSGTSDDNQVHVMLHKEVYSRSDSDAADKAQQLSPSINTSGNNLQVRVPAIEGSRVDLIVTVPANAGQTIVANHGDVHVTGIKASVNVTANHGDVEASAITGPLVTHINNSGSSFSVHSTTGPITVQGRGGDVTISDINGAVNIDGDFFGTTHLEHIRQNVRFHTSRTDFQLGRLDGEINISSDEDLSADQAVGPVILTTRNRNITLERIAGDLSVTNKNGTVDLTSAPPLGNVTVENRNGSVNLTLPEQSAFNVHAETSDGNLQNDFDLPVQDNDHHSVLQGTVGRSGANIHITTSQGDISLKRATVAPLPQAPPALPAISIAPELPADARQALADSKRDVEEAKREAKQAQLDAKREADEAKREAKRAADEAKREAKQAASDHDE